MSPVQKQHVHKMAYNTSKWGISLSSVRFCSFSEVYFIFCLQFLMLPLWWHTTCSERGLGKREIVEQHISFRHDLFLFMVILRGFDCHYCCFCSCGAGAATVVAKVKLLHCCCCFLLSLHSNRDRILYELLSWLINYIGNTFFHTFLNEMKFKNEKRRKKQT